MLRGEVTSESQGGTEEKPGLRYVPGDLGTGWGLLGSAGAYVFWVSHLNANVISSEKVSRP